MNEDNIAQICYAESGYSTVNITERPTHSSFLSVIVIISG